jgi:hypothetical protein
MPAEQFPQGDAAQVIDRVAVQMEVCRSLLLIHGHKYGQSAEPLAPNSGQAYDDYDFTTAPTSGPDVSVFSR